MRTSAFAFALALVLMPTRPAQSQAPERAHVAVPTVAARPEDVTSIDAIIAAFYDVISGPAGQPRQWSRDRSLYIPGVRFVSTGYDPQDRRTVSVMDHQQFVDATDSGFVARGFYETEIHRVTHRVNDIVHVFSTYEMRTAPDGPVFGRGVNSIELYWDGTRWWIAGAVWIDEAPGHPIPADLLPR
jgi:hypothetical protein